MSAIPSSANISSSNKNLTYAQALTDARNLIVQQSNRIKADAEKIKQHTQENNDQRQQIAELRREVDRLGRLEKELATTKDALHQMEATAGRAQRQLETLETANEDLRAVLGQHEGKNLSLTREIEQLRAQLPSEADINALAAMASLLQQARASATGATTNRSGRSAEDAGAEAIRQAA